MSMILSSGASDKKANVIQWNGKYEIDMQIDIDLIPIETSI